MKFTDYDSGDDIRVGDIVFIKYKVLDVSQPDNPKLQFLPRNGKDEYAAKNIASIFLKRPKSRFIKRLLRFFTA